MQPSFLWLGYGDSGMKGSESKQMQRKHPAGRRGFLLMSGRLLRALEIALCAALLVSSYPEPGGIVASLGRVTADYTFDYITWEAGAIGAKLDAAFFGAAPYLDETVRARVVREYLDLVRQIHELEHQVKQVYTDPEIEDPEAATADLRAERDTLRAEQARQQTLAESIIEGQIGAVLRDEGMAVLGQALPPVAMHFTELPNVLVLSPRDRIETEYTQALVPGLPVDMKERIESDAAEALDMSALIVPIGGMALYPSMVIETGWHYSAFEVSVHEWGHHWFFFFPNGLSYFGAYPESIAINETTVSILGYDLTHKVIKRFYPEWAAQLPPLPWETEPAPPASGEASDPPPFDYAAAMHKTRVTVDALLAAGEVDEAEAYMEARRSLFVENGYMIRKLNQAYFAFYGGYQAEGGGAAGEDPIGPAIREIRRLAPSLRDFAWRMTGVVTREDLEAALTRSRAEWGRAAAH